MKAIVTGATSFIGISLCKNLLLRGFEVYAMVRRNSEHLDYLSSKYESFHLIYGDLSKIADLLTRLSDAQRVKG